MAIKIIKFDLPINGTKITTLEALRDNLTDEIVKLARSGQLERWFKSRQLQEQAQAVADAVSQHIKDKSLFLALCAVLEVHPDDVGNTKLDVQPYEFKPMIFDKLVSEETEYIYFDLLKNMFHQKAKLIGMSVGNIDACYTEQFFFGESDPNKIASFAIDIDNTESRLCITHQGRAYLPLLHIFDNHKRHRLQFGMNYKHINFTSKNITTLDYSQNIVPLKNEGLIEHQGKLLIIGEDTIYGDDIALQTNEYFVDYYNLLKIHMKLDGNEFYRIIKLMSFELSDLKLLK